MIHVGMLNSYNVLMGKASVEKIASSGLGIFAHVLEEDKALESVQFMLFYFKELEIYDKCAGLQAYIDITFNKDGTYKEEFCKCDMPDIEEYTTKVKCSICNLRLVK